MLLVHHQVGFPETVKYQNQWSVSLPQHIDTSVLIEQIHNLFYL